MSMLNKGGNVFTLLGIQEEIEEIIEERRRQEEHYNCAEETGLLKRKRGGMVPHFQHTEDCSATERLQNI